MRATLLCTLLLLGCRSTWHGVARFTACSTAPERPANARAFVVLPGETNSGAEPVAAFVSDGAGRFELAPLASGTYCVIEAGRRLSAEEEAKLVALPAASERDCLKRQVLVCAAVWKTARPDFEPSIALTGQSCPSPCGQ